jgi:hypothetical protein
MSMKNKGLDTDCTFVTKAKPYTTIENSIPRNSEAFGILIAPYNPPGIFVPVRRDDSEGI